MNRLTHIIYVYVYVYLFPVIYTAQIVSQFDWNVNPPTLATVGPNATSIGSNATCSAGGVGGTYGLNPGLPTIDINMVVPNTGGIFDIPSIDISIDYRRNESIATIIKRSVFSFNNGAANFRVVYRVNNGGTPVTITSTNINIPQDNTFRNYRFTYDNCSGVGQMYVNNAVVWTSPSPTVNLNLYWVSDGNLIIGQDVDGAGNNIPNLDNFVLQNYSCVILPIELTSFTGNYYEGKNVFTWTTASETNNNYFTIEQSSDGDIWKDIAKIYGAGDSKITRNYKTEQINPPNGINYYRLKQTDFDGKTKKFSVIVVNNSLNHQVKIIKTLDILGREMSNEDLGLKIIYYSDGSVRKQIDE